MVHGSTEMTGAHHHVVHGSTEMTGMHHHVVHDGFLMASFFYSGVLGL